MTLTAEQVVAAEFKQKIPGVGEVVAKVDVAKTLKTPGLWYLQVKGLDGQLLVGSMNKDEAFMTLAPESPTKGNGH